MSYIDALYKKDEDKIYVVERDPKKGRVFVGVFQWTISPPSVAR